VLALLATSDEISILSNRGAQTYAVKKGTDIHEQVEESSKQTPIEIRET
jgi:hypothetical protein